MVMELAATTNGVTTPTIDVENVGVLFDVGSQVDTVNINIDYAIVKHFSEHLYSSPNKAIEELVSNGFDAFATRCYVYVPGEHVQNRVIVWDDGLSMDTLGLQAMWQIARSPKEALGGDRIASNGQQQRAVIGKFGIGKLASYAVGHRISHICKTADGEYLSVSVNYRQFTPEDAVTDVDDADVDGRETDRESRHVGSQDEAPSRTPIRQLNKAEAEGLIRELLPTGAALESMLSAPHWTFAVIDDLKVSKPLYPKRLMWVLGNGMPLRPDFHVFVEDEEVESKLATNASTTWKLNEPRLVATLRTAWDEAKRKDRVAGELNFDPPELLADGYESAEPTAGDPAIIFPTLGRVTALVRLFEDSLASRSEEGRSYGFFLMVRGRLVNPDDDKMLLNDPSFGTFYRSQFQIHANGMDGDLLADRESLKRDTAMTNELRVLQTALYRAARVEVESDDEVKQKSEKPESRLPVRSRELFRDPMATLFSRAQLKPTSIDLDEPVIDRKELGESESLAALEGTTGHLQVNRSHPFYKAVEVQAGGGKKAAAVMRAFDLFAVSERLTEGFLYGRGMSEEQVEDILEWRDKLFRSLAVTYDRNPNDAILELRASSVGGGTRFEDAITVVLNQMGFQAERDGASGQKDIVVVAPVGPSHRVFIVEAKGSAEPVVNVTAALGGAAAHREKVEDAVHAIIVAREFAGFKNKDEPAILEECKAVKGVSVVTVETLVTLYEALLKYSYPLTSIMDALFEIESPKAKLARVEALDQPLDGFNFRDVLDAIWSRQSGNAIKDLVSVRTLWQENTAWRDAHKYEEFVEKLVALSHFAGRLMVLDMAEKTVHIIHHPEKVSEHMERSMKPAFTSVVLPTV